MRILRLYQVYCLYHGIFNVKAKIVSLQLKEIMKSEDSSVVGNPVIEYLVEYTEGWIKILIVYITKVREDE